MDLHPELKQALERLKSGVANAADLETVRRALQAGQIVLATGERAVAIGGSVEDTVIVTGDNTIVSVFKGTTAESVRQALQKVLERIASDSYAASLQEYSRALRRYCAELPYLTLTAIRPPKNLDEVYVPLRARQREEEILPRKPAEQGESLTVEQVLRQTQTPHLLILGQPGAGKSTLLRQLAERAYDDPQSIGLERPHLPLLLPLRALARADGALEERLNKALKKEIRLPRALPDGFLDAWPQHLDAPWLFLLDGLDEVPADSYLPLTRWISDLLAQPNIARVIITSRPSAYTEKEWDTARLSVYEIQPFTRDQTAELARRWFGEEAPAFLQALEAVRSSVLTETPLLITIAAKVYLERKSLPKRRSQLYQEFVNIWLDEARKRGLRDELGTAVLDLAQPALAHLALAMTEHPEWMNEKSLIPVMAEYLNEQLNLKARAPAVAERFLRVMARRSGVFLKREEKYEWVHPTFREYFAALALNQQLEDGKSFEEVLGERALREEWAGAIVALAEVYADDNEALRRLLLSLAKGLESGSLQITFSLTTFLRAMAEEVSHADRPNPVKLAACWLIDPDDGLHSGLALAERLAQAARMVQHNRFDETVAVWLARIIPTGDSFPSSLKSADDRLLPPIERALSASPRLAAVLNEPIGHRQEYPMRAGASRRLALARALSQVPSPEIALPLLADLFHLAAEMFLAWSRAGGMPRHFPELAWEANALALEILRTVAQLEPVLPQTVALLEEILLTEYRMPEGGFATTEFAPRSITRNILPLLVKCQIAPEAIPTLVGLLRREYPSGEKYRQCIWQCALQWLSNVSTLDAEQQEVIWKVGYASPLILTRSLALLVLGRQRPLNTRTWETVLSLLRKPWRQMYQERAAEIRGLSDREAWSILGPGDVFLVAGVAVALTAEWSAEPGLLNDEQRQELRQAWQRAASDLNLALEGKLAESTHPLASADWSNARGLALSLCDAVGYKPEDDPDWLIRPADLARRLLQRFSLTKGDDYERARIPSSRRRPAPLL